jgi:hypothetical protein
VFTWAAYHGGNSVNIWRVNADGTDPKQISDGRDLRNPVCSPDGRWVYFRDTFTGEIKRASIDGGKTEVVPGTKIPDAVLDQTSVAVSPDGQWLAFLIHVEPEGNETAHQTKIVLLSLDPANASQAAACAGRSAPCPANVRQVIGPDQRISGPAAFTPDGKALVYPIREAGVDNLWLQPLEEPAAGAKHAAFEGDRNDAPRYEFVLVAAHTGHEGHHDPANANAAKPAAVPGRQITNFSSDLIDAYHFSLDGKQLGVLQRHAVSDVVLLRDKSAK